MIAITGANGFVGSHLGEFLVKNGIQVLGLVRTGRENVVEDFGGEPHVVDYSVKSLSNALVGVDIVYHFAGATTGNFERDYLQVGKDIIEACEQSGVRKIIFNSGLGVENESNKYFLSRLAMEKEVQNSKLAYTIFRSSTIIGNGHGLIPWDEITPSILESLKNNEKIKIIGDGKNIFQPIFIGDAVKIYHACTSVFDKKIFDFVGPEKITMMDYANMIAEVLKLKPQFQFISREEAKTTGLTDEEIGILMLNETSDYKILEEAFGIKLTSPSAAIKRMFKNL